MIRNFRINIMIGILVLLGTACSADAPSVEANPAKREIGKFLYDSKSARWGEIREVKFLEEETGNYIDGSCGYLNSKNKYGSYAGFTSFIFAIKTDGQIVRMYYDGSDDAAFISIWYKHCKSMRLMGG